MTVDQVEVDEGSDLGVSIEDRRQEASDRRMVLVLIVLATLFGLLAALASMLLTGAIVKLVAAPQPVRVAIIAVGTTVGAAGAGWAAQPVLTRLAVRLAGYRLGRL